MQPHAGARHGGRRHLETHRPEPAGADLELYELHVQNDGLSEALLLLMKPLEQGLGDFTHSKTHWCSPVSTVGA